MTLLKKESLSSRFEQILAGYLAAKRDPYNGQHPIARAMRTLANELKGVPIVREWPRVRVKGSTGAGNWAAVPWVALMDSQETTTTQEGVYCVYLFRADMKGVYLTLNQGVTALNSDLGIASAREVLRSRSAELRVHLEALRAAGFSLDDHIDLATTSQLGVAYQHGCIAYKYYPVSSVPNDDTLLGDLSALLLGYNQVLTAIAKDKADPAILDQLVARFREEFPDFRDFREQGGKYYEEERHNKDEMVAIFQRLFRREDYAAGALSTEAVFAGLTELLQRPLPSTGQPQNLLGWQSLQFLRALSSEQRDSFAVALGELLFGDRPVLSRLDRFASVAEPIVKTAQPNAGSSPVRGLTTLLLMLMSPLEHVLIRSRVVNKLTLGMLGRKLVSGAITARQYSQVRDVYAGILTHLEKLGWKPRDMIDAQGFVWRALERKEDADVVGPDEDTDVPSLQEVYDALATALADTGLTFDPDGLTVRSFLASLVTKRFVILTGLSGSGKTQLALRFGEWLGQGRSLVVAVRPDWTGSEFLFGYEDALLPQRGGRRAWHVPLTLRFMLDAAHDPDSPYILVLDEMNLAHVERYFADMLSGMESRGDCLPNLEVDEDGYWREVSDGSARLPFPRNVFIVGTVNIDETTHMFSPKVLDRANTFEFRVSTDELNPVARVPRRCEPAEARLVAAFVSAAVDDDFHLSSDLPTTAPFAEAFRGVHDVLARHGFEFGHRVYYEGIRFAGVIAATGEERPEVALDLQVLQKVLPRIHGARRRVEPVLLDLAQLTFTGRPANGTTPPDPLALDRTDAVHPRAFDKICRMIEVARMNQFTSYTG